MSQVLSTIQQYIRFGKTLVPNMGTLNLLLVTWRQVTSLRPCIFGIEGEGHSSC